MMRHVRILALLLALAGALLALNATSAAAFGLSGGGFKLGYLDPEASDGGMLVGGHLEFESPGSYWHLRPNVQYWNGDPTHGVNLNLDGLYHFGSQVKTIPYVGGGLGASILGTDGVDGNNSDLGVNLFGGVMFPTGQTPLFLEGRYTISDVNQTSVALGTTFH